MLASELAVGVGYAHRPKPPDGECGLQQVTFVGPARVGKAKVRHRDGDLDGLEEWVRTRSLMCMWADRRSFLRDGSRHASLQQATTGDHDPVVEQAMTDLVARSLELPANVDFGGVEVDVWPGEAERFATAQSKDEDQHVSRIERVLVMPGGFKEGSRFPN